MLVLEIALGIVLAVAIIAFWRYLLMFAGAILGIAIFCVAAIAIYTHTEQILKFADSLFVVIFVVLSYILFTIFVLYLIYMLIRFVFRKNIAKKILQKEEYEKKIILQNSGEDTIKCKYCNRRMPPEKVKGWGRVDEYRCIDSNECLSFQSGNK